MPSLEECLQNQQLIAELLKKYEDNDENNQLVVEIVQNADEFEENILCDYIVQFIMSILQNDEDAIPSKLFYKFCDMLTDIFDISPNLCVALNVVFSSLIDRKYNFYKQPAIFYLLFKTQKLQLETIIKYLNELLDTQPQDLLEQLINNNHLLQMFDFMLQLILNTDSKLQADQKKELNKIIKFILNFPFHANQQLQTYYIEILEQVTTSFAQQQEGIFVVFKQLTYLSDLLFKQQQDLNIDFQTLIYGLLALFGFETNNLLFKNEIVPSKQLIEHLHNNEFSNISCDLINSSEILKYIQIAKMLRNCSMHEIFKVEQTDGKNGSELLIKVYKQMLAVCNYISQQAVQQMNSQIHIFQQTAISTLFTLEHRKYLLLLLDNEYYVELHENKLTIKTNQTKLSKQQIVQNLSLTLMSCINQCLLLQWEDSNSFDIASQFYFSLLDGGSLKGVNAQLLQKIENHFQQIALQREKEDQGADSDAEDFVG